jgi:hypothetical protein
MAKKTLPVGAQVEAPAPVTSTVETVLTAAVTSLQSERAVIQQGLEAIAASHVQALKPFVTGEALSAMVVHGLVQQLQSSEQILPALVKTGAEEIIEGFILETQDLTAQIGAQQYDAMSYLSSWRDEVAGRSVLSISAGSPTSAPQLTGSSDYVGSPWEAGDDD